MQEESARVKCAVCMEGGRLMYPGSTPGKVVIVRDQVDLVDLVMVEGNLKHFVRKSNSVLKRASKNSL